MKTLITNLAVAGTIALLLIVACTREIPVEVPATVVVTVETEKRVLVPVMTKVPVTVEVPVEVTREVTVEKRIPVKHEVEVTREVPVEVTREVHVEKQVLVTYEVEVAREVPVTVEVIATREVPATVEVTREVPIEVTRTVEVTREVPATVEVTREVPVEVTKVVTATPTPFPEHSKPAVVINFVSGGPKEVECKNGNIPLLQQPYPRQRDYMSKGKCQIDEGLYIAYAKCDNFGNNPYRPAGGHFFLVIDEPDDYENLKYSHGLFWKKMGIEFHLRASYLLGDPIRFRGDRYRIRMDSSCSNGWLHLYKDARLIVVDR